LIKEANQVKSEENLLSLISNWVIKLAIPFRSKEVRELLLILKCLRRGQLVIVKEVN